MYRKFRSEANWFSKHANVDDVSSTSGSRVAVPDVDRSLSGGLGQCQLHEVQRLTYRQLQEQVDQQKGSWKERSNDVHRYSVQ